MKTFDPTEKCNDCGRGTLSVEWSIPGRTTSANHRTVVDCLHDGTGRPCSAALPHLVLWCAACRSWALRRPLSWKEPPPPPPPPPDTLDGLLYELSRALLAQFPDGKGQVIFAEVERRLRWMADYDREAERLKADPGWLKRIFGRDS